jgi:hypothetical protein
MNPYPENIVIEEQGPRDGFQGEKKIVPTKQKLGSSLNIDVPSASACIVKEGDAANLVKEIIGRIQEMQRGKK